MNQPLTPAAQAMLDAVRQFCPCEPGLEIAAAVLRALADQVVPERIESFGIRTEILAIAAELEGGNA